MIMLILLIIFLDFIGICIMYAVVKYAVKDAINESSDVIYKIAKDAAANALNEREYNKKKYEDHGDKD